MRIYGLQRLTLLDFPGQVACTVFLSGCNFRCPYCHNMGLAELHVDSGLLDEEDFFDFLEDRKGILDGVAITGGEPLLNPEVELFLRRIKDLGFLVKLDTNGSNPRELRECINAGLVDYIAMDIKSSPGKYASACGKQHVQMEKIKESIKIIKRSGVDYEFRTTAVDELHDVDDFEQIGRLIDGADAYYIQPFVDSPGVPCCGFHPPTWEKLVKCQNAVGGHVGEVSVRGTVLQRREDTVQKGAENAESRNS